MQNINWYPGHMAKAKRLLEEDLRLIDVVIEIVDARAPLACQNPDFDALFSGKQRVVVLNKSDLSSPSVNREWSRYFEARGISALEYNSIGSAARKNAVAFIEKAGEGIIRRYRNRGIAKTLRAMVVGIPNVGKSTFINKLAGVTKAQTGDKPGVTRSKQWVKISPYLELMDTPGLLWARIDSPIYARHIAYIGSIRDDVIDYEQIAGTLIAELLLLCKDDIVKRYPKLTQCNSECEWHELLEGVCKSRGFILSGGALDTERAARIALDEYRAGKLTHSALERPSDVDSEGIMQDRLMKGGQEIKRG